MQILIVDASYGPKFSISRDSADRDRGRLPERHLLMILILSLLHPLPLQL